jgi:hypothetical protein
VEGKVAGTLEEINIHIDLGLGEASFPLEVIHPDKVEPQHIDHLVVVNNNFATCREELTDFAFKVPAVFVILASGSVDKEMHTLHLLPSLLLCLAQLYLVRLFDFFSERRN